MYAAKSGRYLLTALSKSIFEMLSDLQAAIFQRTTAKLAALQKTRDFYYVSEKGQFRKNQLDSKHHSAATINIGQY